MSRARKRGLPVGHRQPRTTEVHTDKRHKRKQTRQTQRRVWEQEQ